MHFIRLHFQTPRGVTPICAPFWHCALKWGVYSSSCVVGLFPHVLKMKPETCFSLRRHADPELPDPVRQLYSASPEDSVAGAGLSFAEVLQCSLCNRSLQRQACRSDFPPNRKALQMARNFSFSPSFFFFFFFPSSSFFFSSLHCPRRL